MPFQISPGVNVTEIDLTTIVPAVATTEGALAGVFRWGPIGEAILVDNEQKLVQRFGKPTSFNAETFFTGANFLAYGNKLYISRAANTTNGGEDDVMSAVGIEKTDTYFRRFKTTIQSGNTTVLVVGTNGLKQYYINTAAATFTANVSAITLASGNTDAFYVGMPISGTGIQSGTRVAAITNTTHVSITLPTTSANSGYYRFGKNRGWTTGMYLSGEGINEDTTISSIVNTSAFVISGAPTANSTKVHVISDYVQVDSDVAQENYNIKNESDYNIKKNNGQLDDDNKILWIAKYPGAMGNSLKVSVCDSADAWSSEITLASNAHISSSSMMTAEPGDTALAVTLQVANASNSSHYTSINTRLDEIKDSVIVGDLIDIGTVVGGRQYVRVLSLGNSTNAFHTTTSSVTINASNTTIVLSAGNTDSFAVGMDFVGTNIPANSTIASITNSTAFVISAEPTGIQSGSYRVSRQTATFNLNLYTAVRTKANVELATINRNWEYFGSFNKAPGQSEYLLAVADETRNREGANTEAQDELHVIVVDEEGAFTGVPGTVVEKFSGLSRIIEAKSFEGGSLYYVDVINKTSRYVWWANDRVGSPSEDAIGITTSINTLPSTISFKDGRDGANEDDVSVANLYDAYDLFASGEDIDISLILQGKAHGGDMGQQLSNYIIDNICHKRLDCVLFLSPNFDSVVDTPYAAMDNVIAFRNALTSSSYAFLDSGYKYQYDRYNDLYRWVPLNGDIAGLAARTDNIADPWYSIAGYNRGIIKNVVRLAFNPSKAERDMLYKSDINPVISIPGTGTVLFGDKTLLGKPSAFDRINVRRLFIVLEKAISRAAKYTLFEFNDGFTRAQFRNLIEPYLRDVQGRRGIYDFKVVCDETNNTAEIIDRNEFVGDIFIKPARSINYIQLNFVAVRTGVSFNEVIGFRQ